MGTDRKTPLSEAGATPPGRSQKTQQRSKVARTRLLVGGLAALAVVGGVLLATGGGDDGGIIGEVFGDDDRPVPEVTLTLSGSSYERTSLEAEAADQKSTTEQVSGVVRGLLESMLRTAYVDPDTWDDPGAVADAYSGEAADRVEADVAVLTLGSDAGDIYEFVDPGKGKVTILVLTGSKAEALRALADVTFPALAEHDDGTYTKIWINGSYVLVHEDETWKIVSYRVDRQEKATEPPSPTASPASEEATG